MIIVVEDLTTPVPLSDAYITVVEADAYFADRLFTDAWTSSSDIDKTKALKMATRAIDRFNYVGTKVSLNQPLQFPRVFISYGLLAHEFSDRQKTGPGRFNTIQYLNQGVTGFTPRIVLDACAEEALAILDRGDSARRMLQQSGVKSASIGGVSETFVDGTRGLGIGLVSQEAKELLAIYIAKAVVMI